MDYSHGRDIKMIFNKIEDLFKSLFKKNILLNFYINKHDDIDSIIYRTIVIFFNGEYKSSVKVKIIANRQYQKNANINIRFKTAQSNNCNIEICKDKLLMNKIIYITIFYKSERDLYKIGGAIKEIIESYKLPYKRKLPGKFIPLVSDYKNLQLVNSFYHNLTNTKEWERILLSDNNAGRYNRFGYSIKEVEAENVEDSIILQYFLIELYSFKNISSKRFIDYKNILVVHEIDEKKNVIDSYCLDGTNEHPINGSSNILPVLIGKNNEEIIIDDNYYYKFL